MIKELLSNKFFVLILMLFLHVFEDFHLQGILADMKQIKWWEKQVGSEYLGRYAHDWVISLMVHSFEWAFIMMLPVFFLEGFSLKVTFLLLFNISAHFIVDNFKCNLMRLNLVQDQIIHVVQIAFTWLFGIVL